jgi:aspirochlorine biosynthesis cytochrome P450 monooxygenase
VSQPFSLSDGMSLPVGTRFSFPSKAIQRDAANYVDPLQFDGFRFAKLQAAEAETEGGMGKWGAATVSKTNLA